MHRECTETGPDGVRGEGIQFYGGAMENHPALAAGS